MDLILDELEDEVLDRFLASSIHAPNYEECHLSYAYLLMLGGKGDASLHSPYRSFPGLAYVRNGEVYYLLGGCIAHLGTDPDTEVMKVTRGGFFCS